MVGSFLRFIYEQLERQFCQLSGDHFQIAICVSPGVFGA
jgi:hypothetical protein